MQFQYHENTYNKDGAKRQYKNDLVKLYQEGGFPDTPPDMLSDGDSCNYILRGFGVDYIVTWERVGDTYTRSSLPVYQ